MACSHSDYRHILSTSMHYMQDFCPRLFSPIDRRGSPSSAAGNYQPADDSFFAFYCCHVRNAVVLASELLRHVPVRSSSLDDPIRQGTFARYPAISTALLRALCVEDAYDIELLQKTPTGPLRPTATNCVWVLVDADFYWPPVPPFWPFLPLHPGSPVLLGSPAPFSDLDRPCAEPSVPNKSSPEATEDLVLQAAFDVCPPPVAAFSGGRAWKMPTEMDVLLLAERLVAQCSDRPQGPWQKAYKYPPATYIRVTPTWCRSSWAPVPSVPVPVRSPLHCDLAALSFLYILSRALPLWHILVPLVLLTAGQVAVKLCLEKYGSKLVLVDRKRGTGGRSRTHAPPRGAAWISRRT